MSESDLHSLLAKRPLSPPPHSAPPLPDESSKRYKHSPPRTADSPPFHSSPFSSSSPLLSPMSLSADPSPSLSSDQSKEQYQALVQAAQAQGKAAKVGELLQSQLAELRSQSERARVREALQWERNAHAAALFELECARHERGQALLDQRSAMGGDVHTNSAPRPLSPMLPSSCSSSSSSLASSSCAPGASLWDLPDAWLLDALRYADCRTLTQFRSTSHAARALAVEVTNTTASSASYLSTSPTLLGAFDDIVPLALSQMVSPPSLAFLFLSPSYPEASLPSAFAHLTSLLPPSTRILGCHGVGILGRDCHTGRMREMERKALAVSMSFLHLPGVDIDARFIDLKTIQRGVLPQSPRPPSSLSQSAAVSGGGAGQQQWLREALGLKERPVDSDAAMAPSFILLASPATIVSSFLHSLHALQPQSSITGALASGGKGSTIGLYTKNQHEPAIQAHTMGIAVLTLTPIPASTPSSAHSPAAPYAVAPPLTGFASRGCKPCSGVYQITRSLNDVVSEVREVQTFPPPDDEEDPLLHPAVLNRLIGSRELAGDAAAGGDSDGEVLEDLLQREQEAERRMGERVTGSQPIEVLDVLREVMQRSPGQDGYINGLFIGLSDECQSAQGRVLCDIVEVQRNGIKVDTESFRAIASTLAPPPSRHPPAPPPRPRPRPLPALRCRCRGSSCSSSSWTRRPACWTWPTASGPSRGRPRARRCRRRSCRRCCSRARAAARPSSTAPTSTRPSPATRAGWTCAASSATGRSARRRGACRGRAG